MAKQKSLSIVFLVSFRWNHWSLFCLFLAWENSPALPFFCLHCCSLAHVFSDLWCSSSSISLYTKITNYNMNNSKLKLVDKRWQPNNLTTFYLFFWCKKIEKNKFFSFFLRVRDFSSINGITPKRKKYQQVQSFHFFILSF